MVHPWTCEGEKGTKIGTVPYLQSELNHLIQRGRSAPTVVPGNERQ